ncbi:MAG: DUF2075 domain-containing protein [Acidocella sp.]|nr:DUF2075 domain-containing protein [Acidocella sp.]
MAIEAFWAANIPAFLHAAADTITAQLAHAAQSRFRRNEPQQLRAWSAQCAMLVRALAALPAAASGHVLFEVSLPRTDRRADVVLLLPGAIVVLEFKLGAERFDSSAREQAEDFALDLQDFHVGSRGQRIVPVLVASDAVLAHAAQPALWLSGVAPVIDANAGSLVTALGAAIDISAPALDRQVWQTAPYRPVPPIIDAARILYARHNVDEILDSRAGAVSLATTHDAIREALGDACANGWHLVLFVTGVPGAGKTLCGLNACFGAADDRLRATFLTGNPALVHVLRAALVRDAVRSGMHKRVAAQRMSGVIQALPKFRDKYAGHQEVPAEHVIVIDEAQRSWSRDHAVKKSRDCAVHLSDSEPGHLLTAMERHRDWSAIVCLIGNGQEIHDGEGGLAEWGVALQSRGHWRIIVAPDCLTAFDPRRRLPPLPGLHMDTRLHLSIPTRQISNRHASEWVDAVLEGNLTKAALIAGIKGVPFRVTRELATLRTTLRQVARGSRRAGLIASSGARRLRAIGLGTELPHMDEGAVARWFLDRFPDVRASDALELVATEFSVQGLELDVVGLCWDGDLIRLPQQAAWHVRAFRGTKWQNTSAAESISNRINTYRVLLTRARHETIILVPVGDATDATRHPATFDAIAAFLIACGAVAV